MNTVHVCLIPSGVHRGEVLVWDGNLFYYGVRFYQPWSIVNPYWPSPNPNYWPGQQPMPYQYRFHNGLLQMPVVGGVLQGELFCAGQCWMADGRLLVCGGTARYPIQTGGGWEGTKFVYLWDPVPVLPTDPFGKWWHMQLQDLEVPRWYPTVTFNGTVDHRGIVIGGTHWTQSGGTQDVNSYEVVRPAFNVAPPQLLAPPNDFDRKPTMTSPIWDLSLSSRRQYWGPAPATNPHFGDYPRIHTLGILDSITGGTAPRLFVSGFDAKGIQWAHDIARDPLFGSVGGQGFEIGQMPPGGDDAVRYCTSLLLPGLPGGISKKVARIGGRRLPPSPGLPYTSNLVETVMVNVIPPATSTWLSTGPGSIPPMNHPRHYGNVVMLPTGELFAIGGENATGFNDTPELLVGGTTWVDMAPHLGARDYHSAAILLPDARVFVCGGEWRKIAPIPGVFTGPQPGPDYLIWEPPYFYLSHGSVPATGITGEERRHERHRVGASAGPKRNGLWPDLPGGVDQHA